MKKLFFLAAVMLSFACNKDLGPEYSTPPTIGKVTFPGQVSPSDVVTVTAPILSKYGLSTVFINYTLNDDESNVKQASPYFYTQASTSALYTGKIPAQKEGTKVSFQVLAISYYSVFAWSEPCVYTVGKETEIEPKPDPTTAE